MKIIISENKIEKFLKQSGVIKTIKLLGGWENFCKVFNIENPTDFLHLFDNLDVVQSEENEDWTLFRYNKGNNYMVYDRVNDDVYINYGEIWYVLDEKFGLTFSDIQKITQEWLDEVYNLRGVTTTFKTSSLRFTLN